jgi:hypothetical protein
MLDLLGTIWRRAPRQLRRWTVRLQAIGNADELNYEIQRAAWFSPGELPEELPKDQAQLIKLALNDGAPLQD